MVPATMTAAVVMAVAVMHTRTPELMLMVWPAASAALAPPMVAAAKPAKKDEQMVAALAAEEGHQSV